MSPTLEQPRRYHAALAGNPNSGKTSLFNALTGSHHTVSNYPGVTVERREGQARFNGCNFLVVDLPGTYSLSAYSAEEVIARRHMIEDRPDVLVDVVDASNLDRNLYLAAQLMEMERPMVLALNMIDVAERRGIRVDVKKLSGLLGVPVVPTIGSTGRGKEDLLSACAEVAANPGEYLPAQIDYGHVVEDQVGRLTELISKEDGLGSHNPRWLAVKLIEKDAEVRRVVGEQVSASSPVMSAVDDAIRIIELHDGVSAEAVIAERRYGFVAGVVRQCVARPNDAGRTLTDRIDAVVCHRLGGPLVLAGVVYLLFLIVFRVSDDWAWLFGRSPTGWMAWSFDKLADATAGLRELTPLFGSLIGDGIIGGVGSVVSFVPLIFTMFLFVAILEDTGYVARAAFVLDRLLRAFGLQGKSILAMIVSGGLGGGGCAVPGVMATRTLREERDRLVTMMVAPLMNCGAKMTVFVLLAAACFPGRQARVLFVMWLLSWVFALCAAWVLRKFVIRGEQTPFVMELPAYHLPTVRGVLMHASERTWSYIRNAGTMILAVSIIIWAMMYFPRTDATPFQLRIENATAQLSGDALSAETLRIQNELAAAQLRGSVAGRIGSALTPLSKWAGFDWKDNIALVGGFAAKEVIVGTLGVAYSMGQVDADAPDSLAGRLAGDSSWTPLRAFCLMVFVMIYAPCITTQVMIWRESRSWKWPLFSTAYATTLAYVVAVAIYQVGGALGIGT